MLCLSFISFLTCFVCFFSTIFVMNSLNSVDVPLSNTKANLLGCYRIRRLCGAFYILCRLCHGSALWCKVSGASSCTVVKASCCMLLMPWWTLVVFASLANYSVPLTVLHCSDVSIWLFSNRSRSDPPLWILIRRHSRILDSNFLSFSVCNERCFCLQTEVRSRMLLDAKPM